LRGLSEHGYVVPARAGRVFTDGFDVVRLQGSQNARILKVESIGGTDVLEFLGARLAGPGRRSGATQILSGFPPHDRPLGDVSAAENAVVEPQSRTGIKGYELLLGYRIRGQDVGARTGIRITYEVAGRTYETTVEAGLITCPKGEPSTTCRRQALGT
jgi:hypothetical protein